MSRYEVELQLPAADLMKPLPEAVKKTVQERFFSFIEADAAQQLSNLVQAAESAGK